MNRREFLGTVVASTALAGCSTIEELFLQPSERYPRPPYRRADGSLAYCFSDEDKICQRVLMSGAWVEQHPVAFTSNLIGVNGVSGNGAELVLCSDGKTIDVYRKTSEWGKVKSIGHPAGSESFVPFGRLMHLPDRLCATVFCMGVGTHIGLIDSLDDGVTWSAPRVVFSRDRGANEMCYFVVDSNRHLMVVRVEDEIKPHISGLIVLKSSDAGKTWALQGEIPASNGQYFVAPDILQLSDGRIVCLFGNRGPIKQYGRGVQQKMSCFVANPADVFDDISAWGKVIDLVNVYPDAPGRSGYGALYMSTSSDDSLSMLWFDGTYEAGMKIYDKNIWGSITATKLSGDQSLENTPGDQSRPHKRRRK
jgi:hypothetical protein